MRCLVGALLAGLCLQTQAGPDFLPQAQAYLVEADGRILWERNADRPLPPASLTKLMTALLVQERGALDREVTVDRAAAMETGSRLGLAPGDRLKAADLMAAALIQSANDACHALADWVAGDEARFVALMNARARQLGLASTRFTNACGHDQPGHRASARDLAALATLALAVPEIARLVALPELAIATTNGRRTFRLTNKNALIGRYPGAQGVKSGYTQQAGKCLIAAAQRDGHRVLLVLLNAPNRWWDASDSLDRAFAELRQPT
ncbi:MAG: D-alanyl-D-alanine carboxypeptidase [Gammaproteobacteria bacterium]|nr:D-alanyl-D-alanine carboxypeptidase [Gammaproteobacteria bacterium]MBU1414338.1 D-alanyl-D-alanine carboxypeptidase [Gammaproteobacteria bacterium]